MLQNISYGLAEAPVFIPGPDGDPEETPIQTSEIVTNPDANAPAEEFPGQFRGVEVPAGDLHQEKIRLPRIYVKST